MIQEIYLSFVNSKTALGLALAAVIIFTAMAVALTFREVTWVDQWPYAQGLDPNFFLGMAAIGWLIYYLITRLIRIWDK